MSSSNDYYGYDPETLAYTYIDPVNTYPTYLGFKNYLPYTAGFDDERKRFVSVLANAAYTFNKRYTASFSARKDASNLFGVSANRRGSPFWSAGLAWDINKEAFFHSKQVDFLKLRVTYGYSGNSNNTVPAIPIITLASRGSINQLPYATADIPPNPSLRWEKVGTFNVGFDFSLFQSRLTGSLEYYRRHSTDLIAAAPADPSTGFSYISLNSAGIRGKGMDFTLHGVPVQSRNFQWNNTLIISYQHDLVEHYENTYSNFASAVLSGSPIEGAGLFDVFAYRFLGLDHDTGAPVGELAGERSINYPALNAQSTQADFVRVGPGLPPVSGSFQNTITYKQFSLSAHLIYKFGYFFKRQGLNYYDLYNSNRGNADFSLRWKQPGDEAHTTIPAMYYPANSNREQFYNHSEAVVEKGDHIRLQEINLRYTFGLKTPAVKQLSVQAGLQNIGIIWRANKAGLDPNIRSNQGIPQPFQAGFSVYLTL